MKAAFTTSYNNFLNRKRILPFDPLTLFQASERGFWLNPSDLTKLIDSSTGMSIEVSASGQRVDYFLDSARSGGLGAEMLVNGTFTGDGTGWTKAGTANGSVTYSNNEAVLTRGSGNIFVGQLLTLEAGVTYQVTGNSRRISGTGNHGHHIRDLNDTASTVRGSWTHPPQAAMTGVKTHYACEVAGEDAFQIAVTTATGDAAFDDMSFRKLLGHHGHAQNKPAAYTTAGGLHWLDFDQVDDLLTFQTPGVGTIDLLMAVRRTGDIVTGFDAPAGAVHFGVAKAGDVATASTSVGTTTSYRINGVDVPGGSATTRDQLNTAWPVNTDVVLEVLNLDFTNMPRLALGFYSAAWAGLDRFYGMIGRQTMTESERTSVRQHLAGKAGITL